MTSQMKTIDKTIISYLYFFPILILTLLVLPSCGKNYSPEQKAYIEKIEKERRSKNEFMKNDPASPFNYKMKIKFHDLNYYDVNPDFVFKSKLYEYSHKDTIIIYGTKGEPRKMVKFGYVKINFKNKPINVNVYEGKTNSGLTYYSIWFTDLTTNKETYGVGRYLDFEKVDDPNYIYTIDFNLAYNPYCAYNPNYSCAIPTKDDFIPIEIKAGEKKFHE
ncbi:DUF1684 domain-containing protein [Melioribacteraceae bacterium 4301-Me]|uniref:DUF1684 domain-containing protein n=1 Tax=Pyranulibacter aquaticus TaxID=3163344 RepID=UPI00359B69A3